MYADLWALLGIPLLIFLARLSDVTLGTLRIIFVSRGMRRLAPAIGFVEVLIWLIALTQVMQHLDHPLNYVAYAAGFATGTWAGILVEERLGIGLLSLRIITDADAGELIAALRAEKFGVTTFAARGIRGRVRLLFTILGRRDLNRALDVVRSYHPRAFVSVSDVRAVSEGFIPRRPLLPPFRIFDSQRKAK
jgi:uncharacterized protein YebE (UPF0316 family)